MSKVVRGIKKVGKAIGGAAKSVWKGLKSTVKKVWDSKIGRIALIGAGVFLGGAALGLWGLPGAGAAAAGSGQAAATSAATQMATTGSTAALGGSTAAGTGASTGLVGGAMGTTAGAGATAGSAIGSAGGAVASAVPAIAPTLEVLPAAAEAGGVASKIFGTIKGLGSGAVNFAKDHPLLTLAGTNMVSQGLQAHQAREDIEAERRRRERNLMVDDVNVDFSLGGRGLIGGRMG